MLKTNFLFRKSVPSFLKESEVLRNYHLNKKNELIENQEKFIKAHEKANLVNNVTC